MNIRESREVMKTFLNEEFDGLDKNFRTHLINCLSGPKAALLVGTTDLLGQENLSIVSSVMHLGANPSLMGMIIRPRSARRHSFENIVESGFWTLNHVTHEMIAPAHQTSARYPKETSEFKATGLTPHYENDFKAPYVQESRIRLGLKLVQVIHLDVNDTEFVIGELVEVHIDETLLRSDGSIDFHQAESAVVTGLDDYHSLKSLARFSYAKPDKDLEIIKD